MPDGNAVVLTGLRVTGRASSVNSGAPCPTAAGSTQSRYSSTRPSWIRDRANLVPPWAMISPPGSCFSRAGSAAVSLRAIRVGGPGRGLEAGGEHDLGDLVHGCRDQVVG